MRGRLRQEFGSRRSIHYGSLSNSLSVTPSLPDTHPLLGLDLLFNISAGPGTRHQQLEDWRESCILCNLVEAIDNPDKVVQPFRAFVEVDTVAEDKDVHRELIDE